METLRDLLYDIGSFIVDKIRLVIDWFMDQNIFNKIIIINTVTCFFAITLPIAKYYIFGTWIFINNPVAVYLIFITIFMFAGIFFHHQYIFAGRVILNLWYFLYVVYMYLFDAISKAPYVLSKGFAFNLIAPVVYLAVSVLLHVSGDE